MSSAQSNDQGPPAPRTLAGWLEFQQRQHPRSVELGLTRVAQVARALGLLQPSCPVITVGGTNGKGSTATALAGLLTGAGRRTGLFTSPHLLRYTERIRIDGRETTEQELLPAFAAIEAARDGATLTFFEYNTLAALWCFRAAACEAIVLEVGLGGRLDSTNIVDADVAVLCSVGMDHMDWLGDSLEAIGAEKAGIFRRARPVVLGSADMPQSVWERLRELECPLFCAEREFRWTVAGDGRWDYETAECELRALPPPALHGAIQYRNFATALRAFQCVLPAACEQRLVATVLQQLRLPGRMQVVPGDVEWVLDVAHNPAAAAVLAAELRAVAPRPRCVAVFGALSDKDVAGVARELDALVDHWLFCTLPEERGLSATELAARCGAVRGSTETCAGVDEACARARQIVHAGERVLVFGSFHTVGPALAWLGLY